MRIGVQVQDLYPGYKLYRMPRAIGYRLRKEI